MPMTSSFLDEALMQMRDAGLLIDNLAADGRLHRVPTEDKPRSKNGAYVIHNDNYPVAWWQNWATETTGKLQGKDKSAFTKKEKQEYDRRMKELSQQAEAERKQKHSEAAKESRSIWKSAKTASATHGYLKGKQIDPYFCRIDSEGRLLVPLYDSSGQLVNLQKILPEKPKEGGGKRYMPGGCKKDCYCPIPAKNKTTPGPLLIAEGYATAASLAMATGFEVWIAFDANNLHSVSKLARSRFPERQIVICADNDRPQPPNIPEQGGIGALKGRKAAESIGAYYALCPLFEGRDKADFNDLAYNLGLDRVRHEIETVLKSRPVTDCPMPHGFYMVEKGEHVGLYYTQTKPDGTSEDIRIGPPLKVLANTRTQDGSDWGLMLRWYDLDKRQHDWAMPLSLLNNQKAEWFTILLDGGWFGDPAYRKHIAKFLSIVRPIKRIRCVTTTGWHDGRYVLPDSTLGNGEDELVLQSLQHDGLYQTAGTMDGWRELASLCVDNPKFGFALSCAFAGPLLALAGLEGGGFNFEGASSCGKTTALQVAASVWGGPQHVRAWRSTDNALELTAALHNDNCLILDELAQVRAKVLDEAVYMLVNGAGKARASKDGGLRKSYHWRVLILSSGELGLADKLQEDGRRSKAGQDARFVAVPVSKSDIANLHGLEISSQFIRQIKRLAETNYGHAGRIFLENLTQKETLQNAKDRLRTGLDTIIDSFCPGDCDGQVRRVALRFALVAIAGILAREMNLLPSDFQAEVYARKCFMEWIEQRGGIGAAEDMKILEQVQLFIEQHGQSRFQDIADPNAICINRAGYRENAAYYCLPQAFRAEIIKGYSPKRAIEVLAKAGWLLNDRGRNTRLKWIPNIGTIRVYTIQIPQEKDNS